MFRGETENRVLPTGLYTDTFSTELVLAMFNQSGAIEQDRATLRPTVDWAYFKERSKAYVDALSNPVGAQRYQLNELDAGIDWVMPLGSGAVDFTGGASAIFTAEEGGNDTLQGGGARIDLGLRTTGEGRYHLTSAFMWMGCFRKIRSGLAQMRTWNGGSEPVTIKDGEAEKRVCLIA